jgi:hypothetical protein
VIQGPHSAVAACVLAVMSTLVSAPRVAGAQHAQPAATVTWVKFTDPVEHAFTIDGPRGYVVRPMTVRRGPIDYVLQTRAVAADSSIDVRINDGGIPAFSEPTRMGQQLGQRVGMVVDGGHGQRFMIEPYEPALPFAYDYGKKMMAPFCAQPALKAARPLPVPPFAAPATPISTTDVGEVYFECPNNGRVGYVYLITSRYHQAGQEIGTWGVFVMVGFVATHARAGEAFAIMRHMAFSTNVNQQWYMANLQTAERQTADINAEFDRQNAARESQLANTDRNQDREQQSFEDIMNGVTPTVDPQTGEKREVATGSKGNYYWTDQNGHTVNTSSWMAPGPNYRPLQVAPR